MRSKTWFIKLLAALMVMALLGAACSEASDEPSTGAAQEENDDSMGEETPAEDDGEEQAIAVDTAAATLTRDLTSLLNGHEYLAGSALGMAVLKGPDSAEAKAAAAALDENSVDLSKAIAGVYGDEAGTQFLELWRKHIGFFVNYTLAGGKGPEAKKAVKDLDGYRSDFGAFLESAGILPKDAVAEALTPHVESTLTTIDTLIGLKKGNVFSELKIAASHLPGIATALSSGISMDQGLDGTADDPAASLQRDLTYLLGEHEYLAGLAIAMAVMNGPDSDLAKASAAALDENSVDLSKAVSGIYGDEAGTQFLELWRKHIGFFVNYTLAGGEGPEAKKALKDLDNYRSDFGAFLESAGTLPKDAVADALKPHVAMTIDAIDALLGKKDGNPFSLLYKAAGHMPMIATALAGGITAQFPEQFAR